MKKLLKKSFVIVLCLAMVLGLAACGGGDAGAGANNEKPATALEMYNAAAKLAAEADSMSANYDINLNMLVDAMDIDMPMVGYMELILNDGTPETIEYVMDMDTEILGMSAHTVNYVKDGMAYVHTEAEGETVEYKTAATADYTSSMSQFTEYQEFAEDMVLEQSVVNGVAAITLDGAKIKEFALGMVGSGVEDLLGEGNNFEIDQMVINFTVDEAGMFKDITMQFSMKMVIDATPVVCTIDMVMEYTGYNNVDAIDFPDFSAYEEI